jgi:cobaltochelatase CobN
VVDLEQTPAEVVILSAADTDLLLLADACDALGDELPSLRLASLLALRANASVDLYVESVLRHARLVVVAMMGGTSYWPYGVEQLAELAHSGQLQLVLVPGDDTHDPELVRQSTASPADCHAIWRYLREGGPQNARALLQFLAARFFGRCELPPPPRPLPKLALYHPREQSEDWRALQDPLKPTAAVLFYRAHLQAGNLSAFAGLIEALERAGLNPLPIAGASLKETALREQLAQLLREGRTEIVLNTTGFAISSLDQPAGSREGALGLDCPVLQVIASGGNAADWRVDSQGLSPRDLAMSVVLPEVDGRIITRAFSFKGLLRRSLRAQVDVAEYQVEPDRAAFIAELALRWVELARTPRDQRRVALVLANYPARDGRIGNGVGLDTPASTVTILRALEQAGYAVADIPADSAALLALLTSQVTNDLDVLDARPCWQSLALADYRQFLAGLPAELQHAIDARWGAPEQDPRVRQGRFVIAGIQLGLAFVGIQPARGYQIDYAATYHDPDLVPPHGYLAFYAWLRRHFQAHAVVHIGKHGSLEWLPGKSVALSRACWPEAIFGALPHLYPFIVNDPGEGTQAKRRAQAVIIGHLVPPLTRAESYGALRDLECLVDEYYQALVLDPPRAGVLRKDILKAARTAGLHRELAAQSGDDDELLRSIDAYLCELKESQIRDGLHVFGHSPEGEQRIDTLAALARFPTRSGAGADESLLRALARALLGSIAAPGGGFDPLDCDFSSAWTGPRPEVLAAMSTDPWRSAGDTRERLELFARALLAGDFERAGAAAHVRKEIGAEFVRQREQRATGVDGSQHAGALMQMREGIAPALGREEQSTTRVDGSVPAQMREELALVFERSGCAGVLARVRDEIAPALDCSGAHEIAGLLGGLDGRFVPPGPSGAPSRGRLDVLPTGRNFYSVDVRALPTPAAHRLGQRAADRLVQRYLQDHGEHPRCIALSLWGTATMRTGGDDVAQALALVGVRPVWAAGSARVVDTEILPASVLRRPRVDVVLRISGFFRDAFPDLIRLLDSAVRAVSELDEPEQVNPLRARVQRDAAELRASGVPEERAAQQARARIFGSRPGAYGAGLNALVERGAFKDAHDLARAYLDWGGYVYGQGEQGAPAHERFQTQLSQVDAVLQNQDNREHDLLDSGDYYEFHGGMAAAVELARGSKAALYHGDHQNPEAPRIRGLNEELGRVIRSRAVNPKWIAAARRHGYKGAAEMAATVEYLFGYSAATGIVEDHQFALVTDAYLLDAENRAFLSEHNPSALTEMTERMLDAIARGLWQHPGARRDELEALLIDVEEQGI